jgi:hypothetical protein
MDMKVKVLTPPTVAAATGTGAINLTYTNATRSFRFDSVTVKLSAVPTLAGNLTITHTSVRGAGYAVPLYTTDPSVSAVSSIIVALPFLCEAGDTITVAYANPSAVTYNATIRTEVN